MSPHLTLRKAGFTVTIVGSSKINVRPKSKLTNHWRSFIREHKSDILADLKTLPKPPPLQPTTKVPGGVGTELHNQIPKWFESNGCGCRDYAAKLDRKGITWCDQNRDEITNHLVNKATETFLGSISETLDRAVATRWLNKAIPVARTAEAGHFAELLSRNPIIDLPDDTIVITAADDRFISGATLLAWTILQQHRCRIRVYDLGISRGPMRNQLLHWGIELVKPSEASLIIPRGVPAWQIFNKPVYINHALQSNPRVLWLDSDTAVGGDMTPTLMHTPFIPDHGGYNASGNATREPITELLGPDVETWHDTHYPCAGVVGLSRADAPLVTEWLDRTRRVYDADRHQHAQYFDQSILQTHYTGPLADGAIYNSFTCPRDGDQRKILKHLIDYPDRVIHHFGGSRKPFLDWPMFAWPMPRGAA